MQGSTRLLFYALYLIHKKEPGKHLGVGLGKIACRLYQHVLHYSKHTSWGLLRIPKLLMQITSSNIDLLNNNLYNRISYTLGKKNEQINNLLHRHDEHLKEAVLPIPSSNTKTPKIYLTVIKHFVSLAWKEQDGKISA